MTEKELVSIIKVRPGLSCVSIAKIDTNKEPQPEMTREDCNLLERNVEKLFADCVLKLDPTSTVHRVVPEYHKNPEKLSLDFFSTPAKAEKPEWIEMTVKEVLKHYGTSRNFTILVTVTSPSVWLSCFAEKLLAEAHL
jgi:hypothetical protein